MGARILIAEDEPHIVEALSFVLGRAGHEVASVADGERALAYLRGRETCDLLILDVMLPGRNGFEVLKAVKSDERLKGLPVLMLTAKAQAHDRALAQEIGADAYVSKPFSNRDIVEQVARLLTRA
jgi:DNA-binding response OmpR family regulator